MKCYISEAIAEYKTKDKKPWHMPGHKRKSWMNPVFAEDFTEVPGLDDYHHASGIIRQSQEELAKVYKTFSSHYLVNGSTCGILSAIYACCMDADNTDTESQSFERFSFNNIMGTYQNTADGKKRKAVMIARNCHKSVFHALELLGVQPIYIYPDYFENGRIYGEVKPERIRELLEHYQNLDIRCCIVTSPTYEGVISDIQGISAVLHEQGIRLIVDEAHGAHLPFSECFGRSAVYCGADFVIESLHKTLPALTQTAVIHIPYPSDMYENVSSEDEMFEELCKLDEALKHYLSVFQSASPSYIFMKSMEECVAWCDENRKEFSEYAERIRIFRKKAEALKNIRLFSPEKNEVHTPYDYDTSRLVFLFDKITGEEAQKKLEENYGIVVEMSGVNYVTLITSVMDTREDYEMLFEALRKLDNELDFIEKKAEQSREADILINTEKGMVSLKKSAGLRIRNYIYVYPPGIPLIAPYEVITQEMINEVILQVNAGKRLCGIVTKLKADNFDR